MTPALDGHRPGQITGSIGLSSRYVRNQKLAMNFRK